MGCGAAILKALLEPILAAGAASIAGGDGGAAAGVADAATGDGEALAEVASDDARAALAAWVKASSAAIWRSWRSASSSSSAGRVARPSGGGGSELQEQVARAIAIGEQAGVAPGEQMLFQHGGVV